MGSVVKSIGKVVRKVGKGVKKIVKKAGPTLLLAAALYAGTAAFGSSLAGSTGNMFSWGNFTSGASQIGSSITGGMGKIFGTSATKAGPTTGLAGSLARVPGHGGPELFGSLGRAGGGDAIAGAGLSPQSGITGFISKAVSDSPAMALLGASQIFGAGLSFVGNLMDNTPELEAAAAEKAFKESQRQFDLEYALAQQQFEEAKHQFEVQHTFAGFKPGTTSPSDLPKTSNFWRQGPTLSQVSGVRQEPGFGRQPSQANASQLQAVAQARGPSMLNRSGPGLIGMGTTDTTRLS